MILKYCNTCKIYRPPRCSHCRQCQNCVGAYQRMQKKGANLCVGVVLYNTYRLVILVENEDHHCIWLNNCIGRRNYVTFFTFILTATVICFYVLGFSLVHLFLLMHERNEDFLQAIMDAPIRYPFCFENGCKA